MRQSPAFKLSVPERPFMRTYFPKPSTSPADSYATRFFKGVEEVKVLLVKAIIAAIKDLNEGNQDKKVTPKVTPESLDKECGLGVKDGQGRVVPSMVDILKDNALLTTAAFTRVAFRLGLKLDEILVPKLSPRERSKILKEMCRGGFGVKATEGGTGGLPKPAQQVDLFIAVSVFREIDLTK